MLLLLLLVAGLITLAFLLMSFNGSLPVHGFTQVYVYLVFVMLFLNHTSCTSLTLLQNLNQNPRTLLPKFYGLYCVQCGGKNIRVVVMNNILPRSVRMHLKFDLKGSTYKRRASKKEREKSKPTFKDLDFMTDIPEGLILDQDTYGALVKTLQRDCLVRKNLEERTSAELSLSYFKKKPTIM